MLMKIYSPSSDNPDSRYSPFTCIGSELEFSMANSIPIANRRCRMPLMSTPDWPDHLDALIAAPAYHSLLFENETVRVVETHVPAGHTVPLHTHCWPGVQYIVSWSDFVRRDSQG